MWNLCAIGAQILRAADCKPFCRKNLRFFRQAKAAAFRRWKAAAFFLPSPGEHRERERIDAHVEKHRRPDRARLLIAERERDRDLIIFGIRDVLCEVERLEEQEKEMLEKVKHEVVRFD